MINFKAFHYDILDNNILRGKDLYCSIVCNISIWNFTEVAGNFKKNVCEYQFL